MEVVPAAGTDQPSTSPAGDAPDAVNPGDAGVVVDDLDSTGGDRGWSRPWSRLAGVGFVVVATAAQLWRQPPIRSWNTIWAEDGRVYTTDALSHPAWKTILRGYQGYAQVVPRLLAQATRVIPLTWFAPYFALVGTLLASLFALAIVRSSRGWIANEWLRWLLGFLVVLSPVAVVELTGNITNLNWTLFVASFWLIASQQESRPDTVMRAGLVGLSALTTTLTAIMLPWAIVVAVWRRRRSDYAVLITLVAALFVQFLAWHATTQVPVSSHPTVRTIVRDFAGRVLGSIAIGERWLPHWWDLHPHGVEVAATLGVVVLVLLARPWRARPDHLVVASAALVLGVAVLVFTLWFRGDTAIQMFFPPVTVPAGSRYVFPPTVFVLSGLLVLVDSSGRAWLKALLAAQAIVVVASSLVLVGPRPFGPSWSTELKLATARCQARPPGPSRSAPIVIPISPRPWSLTIPCDRLTDPP